jgi:hypothetical protein
VRCVPVSDTQPVPVSDTYFAPPSDTQPVPVSDTQPVPVSDTQSVPVSDSCFAPRSDTHSVPVSDTYFVPVFDVLPAPEALPVPLAVVLPVRAEGSGVCRGGPLPLPLPVSQLVSQLVSWPVVPAGAAGTAGCITQEITAVLGALLDRDGCSIEAGQCFELLGLDSLLGAQLTALLGAVYGCDLEPADLYDHPTPADLARHLAGLVGGAPPARPVSHRAVPPPAVARCAARGGLGVQEVLQSLCEELAHTLCCDLWDIDPGATFRALGLDTVLGAQFVACLNTAYGLGAGPAILFDHPTAPALAQYIAAHARPWAPQPPAP